MTNILLRLILSQFKIFFREPGVIFWSFGFPILMAWILGITFTKKAEISRSVGIVTEISEPKYGLPLWLLKKIDKTPNKDLKENEIEWDIGKNQADAARIRFRAMKEEEAVLAMKQGVIALWIEGHPDLGLNYRFDPGNEDARITYLLLERAFRQKKMSQVESNIRPLTMIGIRYIDFLIPGLMAMSIMNACLWGIGWNLIELRIKKLLRRMIATPLKKSIFLISHGLNRMILSAAEMLLLYIFAYFYFGINIQGSLLALGIVFFWRVLCFRWYCHVSFFKSSK